MPRVVIVGGGFGGLYAARALAGEPVAVTLVDRHGHHLFQPLLYQVATAALAAPDVAAPIRRVLRKQANATVLLAEVTAIDTSRRRVVLEDGELGYDFLVLAAGMETGYFGNDAWAEHAPGLKTLEDAFEVRRRIFTAFEHAERIDDAEERAPWLTFCVVGAGPTGVELAGALREIATNTLARDFRKFDPTRTRVVVADLSENVLSGFPDRLSERAREMLEERGVELRLGERVTGIDERGVDLGDERLEARTVLWAAGVRPSSLAKSLGAPLTRDGRVEVESDLSIDGHPEAFVVGDLAAVKQDDGDWVPGMAPAAIQEGRHAARAIAAAARGQHPTAFRYVDKGMLATIGRAAAVARVGRFHASGFLAWVLWLVVHVLWLIGFRNRVVVAFEWAWAWFTYQRSARVLVDVRPAPGRRSPR